MGKARSYEIVEYRKIIMEQLCTSKEIVKLFGCENEKYPENVIPFNFAYPHEYIPEIITTTDRFINFDVSASLDVKNNVYKDLTIFFFVVCHQDVVKYIENGRSFLWYDRAVCELDNIFCNHNILGIGETLLSSNVPYCPQQKFKGRMLKFIVKDFNNGLRYGK